LSIVQMAVTPFQRKLEKRSLQLFFKRAKAAPGVTPRANWKYIPATSLRCEFGIYAPWKAAVYADATACDKKNECRPVLTGEFWLKGPDSALKWVCLAKS